MDFAAEEVEDGGEAADVVGSAREPLALRLGLHGGGGARLFLEMTNQWEGRGGLLFLEIFRAIDGHRHVRLAGTEPDVADEYVGDLGLAVILALGGELAAFGAGRQRLEAERPFAGRISFGILLLASELDDDLFVGISPAPDRDGLVALEDHVVGEDGR